MQGISQEPPFIKEKLVSVWMELAKRDWPQEWPDMIPRALELCQSNSVRVLILLFPTRCSYLRSHSTPSSF